MATIALSDDVVSTLDITGKVQRSTAAIVAAASGDSSPVKVSLPVEDCFEINQWISELRLL
jgi:hypothetical protein